jgi:hypothetical protein
MRRRFFTQTVSAALLAFPFTACAEGDRDSTAEIDGSTKDIGWGEHWAGPTLKRASDLEGKVVLLKIWGG